MRFISSTGQKVVLLNPVGRHDPYHENRFIIEKPGFQAEFRTGDYTTAEKQWALEHLKFSGIGLQPDAITPLDPSYRIYTYDTDQVNFKPYAEAWGMDPDEFKDMIEQKLLDSVYHGSDFHLFEAEALAPPWKGYDSLRAVKRIVELTQETGSDPEDVIAYEKQGKNRPEVIEALEALLVPEPAATVIQA